MWSGSPPTSRLSIFCSLYATGVARCTLAAWFSFNTRHRQRLSTASIDQHATRSTRSEIGDKTFFVAALFAMKASRLVSFVGSIGALAVMTIFAVLIGQVIAPCSCLITGCHEFRYLVRSGRNGYLCRLFRSDGIAQQPALAAAFGMCPGGSVGRAEGARWARGDALGGARCGGSSRPGSCTHGTRV